MAVSDADILGWLNANPDASDALIAQTMQEAGVTPDRMAQVTNTDVGAIQARYDAAIAAPAAVTTVEDLYREILGREPDAEGLAFWSQGFGDKVDATEKASFLQAASSELAKRTPAEREVLAPNFDSVADAKKAANAATAVAKAQTDAEVKAAKDKVIADAKASADALAKLTPEELITKQILAQNLTGKWSGEGHGSAENNAKDMAKIIAATGAKSIKDFGKVPVYEPVQEIGKTYNGQYVRTFTDEETGKTTQVISVPSGQYDSEGNEYYNQ